MLWPWGTAGYGAETSADFVDLATKRYLAGDHLAAADLLEKALAKDPEREDARDLMVEVLKEYGSSLRQAGKYEAALATFKRARKVMPANAQLMDLITATERAMEDRGMPTVPAPAQPAPESQPVASPIVQKAGRPPAKPPVRALPSPISFPAPTTAPVPARREPLPLWTFLHEQFRDPWALAVGPLLFALGGLWWQSRFLRVEIDRLRGEVEERRVESFRLREEVRGQEQALRASEARAGVAEQARREADARAARVEVETARVAEMLSVTREEAMRAEAADRESLARLRDELALLKSSAADRGPGKAAAGRDVFRREQAALSSLIDDIPGADVEAARERTASQARALYALNPSKALAFFRNLAGGSSVGARRTAAWIAGAIPLEDTLALLERLAQDPDALVAREGLKTLKQIAEAGGAGGTWPPALRPRAAEALARARSSGEWVV